ncbi:hypothetical protein LZ32DRAFT_606256 [Colletotrichum eremochloae]|nr:hypothetical protein LZ32DRAFT_606256 [Colletotrichum eremochloae]
MAPSISTIDTPCACHVTLQKKAASNHGANPHACGKDATPLQRSDTSGSSTRPPGSPVNPPLTQSPQSAVLPLPTMSSTTPTPRIDSCETQPPQEELRLTRKPFNEYTKHDLGHVQSHLQALIERKAEGAPYNEQDMGFLRRVERKIVMDRRIRHVLRRLKREYQKSRRLEKEQAGRSDDAVSGTTRGGV